MRSGADWIGKGGRGGARRNRKKLCPPLSEVRETERRRGDEAAVGCARTHKPTVPGTPSRSRSRGVGGGGWGGVATLRRKRDCWYVPAAAARAPAQRRAIETPVLGAAAMFLNQRPSRASPAFPILRRAVDIVVSLSFVPVFPFLPLHQFKPGATAPASIASRPLPSPTLSPPLHATSSPPAPHPPTPRHHRPE